VYIRTDNRLINLRWCSSSENSHNSNLSNKNTSGIKGISFKKSINKYCASIWLNNKYKYIGCFRTLEQAVIARKKVANKLFGEFTHSSEKY
jgi:hypothetical protein